MKVVVSVVGLAVNGRPGTGQSVAQETDRRWRAQLPEGSTVDDLIKHLRLPARQIQLLVVNGQCAGPGYVLHEGDAVAFTGPVAGE